ncbi:diaminopimelate epimerase [Tundrisphaera sp. TA3]|uniref:diaminopimelate epimerase n=1 Tax=Tundrisphaera sp. TA3 TaxID=3435775 RepID=UPI003EBB78F8
MKFAKMHGLGNDYVYVSTFDQPAPRNPAALSRAVSDRHFGIGSDGLILIEPTDRADARMRMFNADGSESEMCGNGVRCVAKFIHDRGIAPRPRVTVETGRGLLTLDLEIEGGKASCVRVDMGPPILDPDAIPTTLPGQPPVDVPLQVGGHDLAVTAVSMGNPHAVIYVEDVDRFPVETLGPLLENHPAFPKRVNVHFVEVLSPREVRMRTWERGSGITMACGTGACAVAVAGVLNGQTGSRLLAHLPGGPLELEWDGGTSSVFMTGAATHVYDGTWNE